VFSTVDSCSIDDVTVSAMQAMPAQFYSRAQEAISGTCLTTSTIRTPTAFQTAVRLQIYFNSSEQSHVTLISLSFGISFYVKAWLKNIRC